MPATALNPCHYCQALTLQASYCCEACRILDGEIRLIPASAASESPYAYLDQSDFRELYRQPEGAGADYLFFAEGLHCSSCVHLLEKLPQFYEGISSARVNFAASTVAVSLHESASLAHVAYVIQELGYRPSILNPNENPVEKYIAENRAFLRKIAVAGFCAGNIMLFVIPVYAGLAGTYRTAFNWMSFLLFLPILFYSAQPFYQGSLNSLKYRVVNVDLPIAIAMLSGFILSTINLIRGDGDIYFDSTASFLFLILSARYLLKRVQQNYLSPSRLHAFVDSVHFNRITGSTRQTISLKSIQIGDVLELDPGQSLPCDGNLLSPEALIDMSLFNGESLPKHFACGMQVFAGTKVLNQPLLMTVGSTLAESKLGRLLQELDKGNLEKNSFVSLTDRLAQKLILTVFSIALIFFAIYSFIDFSEAFNRSLALLVLACPCALAFGSPLTFGLALKKAQKLGILIKSSSSLERILKVKNIFFDKTGTLTEGNLSLSHTEPMVIQSELRKIILSLESKSYHPVAFALRKAWESESFFAIFDFQENLGVGVRGQVLNHSYEIKSVGESTHESEIAVEVKKDGQFLARLYFTDALRADSAQAVLELKNRDLGCYILSGDKKSRVLEIARQVGIETTQAVGELYPEDKQSFVQKLAPSCMIGDGANDSLSLQSADVGISVKGSVDLSLRHSDVYLTRGGLSPFLDFIQLAEVTQRTLHRNLTLSLIYNLTGGLLALLGFISPMMAAILMPLSSLLVILSSLWGFR
jgi:Cu+-exporting ATPase